MHPVAFPAAAISRIGAPLALLTLWVLDYKQLCSSPRALCRIQGVFAQPHLVDAHRRLLAAALKDERNSMFLLISESCIPLYHPALFWAQLQAENHISRVSTLAHSLNRRSEMLLTDSFLDRHFRKSAQWSSLTRMHAMVAAYDEHVWQQFKAFCRTMVRCALPARSSLWHACLACPHRFCKCALTLAESAHMLCTN